MKKIVTTQKEFDNIKDNFKGDVIIKDTKEPLIVNRYLKYVNIYVSGNAVIESVYNNAIIKDVSDYAVIKSVYDNAVIKYVYGNSIIKSVYGDAVIEDVYGNAVIKSVYGDAIIKSVYDNAVIESVSDNAVIKYVYDNAVIKSIDGSAIIKSVSDNVVIESVYGDTVIEIMSGFASILELYLAKKIEAQGFNIIRKFGDKKINIKIGKNVKFIKQKQTFQNTPTINFYLNMYPVKHTKTKIILYKAVHKINDKYFSDYDKEFEYKIGKIQTEKINPSKEESCSTGIHVAYKDWAISYGNRWKDLAILECKIDKKDIIVAKDCNGEVRASKIEVLRELPKNEY